MNQVVLDPTLGPAESHKAQSRYLVSAPLIIINASLETFTIGMSRQKQNIHVARLAFSEPNFLHRSETFAAYDAKCAPYKISGTTFASFRQKGPIGQDAWHASD